MVVHPKEQRVPIQIIIPGNESVKLYKGMKVENLQQVDDVETTDPVFASEDTQNGVDFDFNHMKLDEKSQIEHLLSSYQDIFATSSEDLGLTSL